ncbi:MAG: hypothetical protein M3305_09105, partial [Actinomycetota bacterium]|nr:hypothetical protein [Actinomycetota bacterium]
TAAIVEYSPEQSALPPGLEASIEQSALPPGDLSGESLPEAMSGSGAPPGNPDLGGQSTQVPFAAGPPQVTPVQEPQPVAFVTEPIVPAEQTFPAEPIFVEEPSAFVEPASAGEAVFTEIPVGSDGEASAFVEPASTGEAVFTEIPVGSDGEASAFVEPASAGEAVFTEVPVSPDGASDLLVAASAGDAMAVVDSGGVTATAGDVAVRA